MAPDWTRVGGDDRKKPYVYDTGKSEATKVNAAEARKKSRDAALTGAGLPTGENPTTSEIDYADDEFEFLKAMDRYKREKHRPHPTYREVLKVLLALGYVKVFQPGATDGTSSDGHAGPVQAVG